MSTNEADALPELSPSQIPEHWHADCNKPVELSSFVSRQRIYVWWMQISKQEREEILKKARNLRD